MGCGELQLSLLTQIQCFEQWDLKGFFIAVNPTLKIMGSGKNLFLVNPIFKIMGSAENLFLVNPI